MHCKLTLLATSLLMLEGANATDIDEITLPPQVVLAESFELGIDITQYWQSEKLDGIRAFWDGTQLKTRSGKLIHAPTWFTRALPKMKVEGELWAGRGNFHVVQQTVLDRKPIDAAWREIKFMLFDLPETAGDFRQRYSALSDWVNRVSEPHIGYIKHVATTSQAQLFADLDEVHQNGGEGLMLRKFDSEYSAGRSHDLLKLKHHQDDEAVVIGYKTGNGKYAGMLGSLLVQWRDGKQFYLGSGLSDSQRIQPPPIGSVVTFRYNGLTSSGLPRFARFERLRVD